MFGWFRKRKGGGQGSAPPPLSSAPLVPEGPMAQEDLRLALERPCAPVIFHKPASIDPFATLFGAVRLSRAGEMWPQSDGAPMWPLCQLNLTAAPLVPDALRDLALLTVFLDPTHSRAPTRIINTADPDPAATWVLRSYTSLDRLTIPTAPIHDSPLSPRLGAWAGMCPDYANHDMAGHVVDTNANDVLAPDWARQVAQTKLGGWPATVQSEPWWDYTKTDDTWDFVLQIENEPKAGWHGWGDGAAYIARSRQRPHFWAIDVQFT